MDQPDRVVGEQGVGAAGDFAVMADVVGGVGARSSRQSRSAPRCADPARRAPRAGAVAQDGLADQDDRERGSGVHVVVGQQPDRFELMVVEQVGFVDDEDGVAAPFGVFGGQRLGGLGGEGGR